MDKMKSTGESKMNSLECVYFELYKVCGLSDAEICVVHLLLKGYNQKQIATMRFRSIKTISSQKTSAFKKLGIRREISLLSVLLQKGLIKIPDYPEC